jgi:hypothetical protein
MLALVPTLSFRVDDTELGHFALHYAVSRANAVKWPADCLRLHTGQPPRSNPLPDLALYKVLRPVAVYFVVVLVSGRNCTCQCRRAVLDSGQRQVFVRESYNHRSLAHR